MSASTTLAGVPLTGPTVFDRGQQPALVFLAADSLPPGERRIVRLELHDGATRVTTREHRLNVGDGSALIPLPLDTSVYPGRYTLRVSEIFADGSARPLAEPRSIEIRPRRLGPAVEALAWREAGERMRAMGFAATAYQEGEPAERDGIEAIARVSVPSSLGKGYPERNRDGKPRADSKKAGFVALAPEVRERFGRAAAQIAERLAPYSIWKYLNIAPERRPLDDISFDDWTHGRWREVSGQEIPAAVERKTGVDYRTLPGFPASRLVPDDHPVLAFYRWLWREGDGWPGLYTAAHRAARAAGRNDVVSYVAPALRVPSLGGINGEVEALFHWGYVHPDPTRLGKCADELLAMARYGGRTQQAIMMTQLFVKRSYVTPKGAAAAEADPSLDLADDRNYPLTATQLEIAFWSKVSRGVDHIAYNGLRNMVPADWTVPPAGEDSTLGRLRDLLTQVLQPLGPTFAALEEPAPRVGFLQSFAAEVFAGRGTFGWPMRGWREDAYMALVHAGLQPAVLYDDMVKEGGLDGLRALVLVHCDVLPAGVAERIRAFQGRGGIVVGDEHLAPGLRPDLRWAGEAIADDAARRKATLIRKGAELRRQLESQIDFPFATSHPDLVARLRVAGEGRYVFLVNDARRSGKTQGRHGMIMEDGLPLRATVRLAGSADAVYDLRKGVAVPFRREPNGVAIDLDFAPGEGTVLLVLERPVGGVKVETANVRPGQAEQTVRVTVHDDRGRPLPAAVPVRVDVRSPSGRPGEFSGWQSTRDGVLDLLLEPGSDQRKGVWTVDVREGASGRSASLAWSAVARP